MDVSGRIPRRTLILTGLATSVSLQGCSTMIPTHETGYWQNMTSYLENYKFETPGLETTQLNPCALDIPRYLQCSGHGECKAWTQDPTRDDLPKAGADAPRFCYCAEGWADPNCETPRKSQRVAFLLSLFGGVLGLDQLYLGFFFPYGLLKLLSLGGLGIWWIYDLVRIGTSPVDTARSFKVARNVPHWAFVLSATIFFVALAFVYSAFSIRRHRVRKQREVMLLQSEGAAIESRRQYSGYGSTLS
ncbi:unnamed protein product [Symbiodinium sp. CCMP2592]|nr:unnamed protein product [Symbiodinium sp. CCMP2592]